MTDLKLSTITKPSLLIKIALTDLITSEKSPTYFVDMGTWHSAGGIGSEICSVCLAGSIMAHTLKTKPYEYVGPSNFKSEKQLNAVDCLRTGNVTRALVLLKPRGYKQHLTFNTFLDSEYEITSKFDKNIVSYEDNPKKFKRQMRNLAKKLESVGL